MKQVAVTLMFLLLMGVGTLHAESKESKEAMKFNQEGAELVKQGRMDEAIQAFQNAIAEDSSDPVPRLNLAYAYDQQGKKEQAVAMYQEAIQLDPRNLLAYNNLGVLYDKLGKYEEAMTAFQSALEIDPSDANTLQNLENAKKSKGVIEEREAQFAELRSAVEAKPDDPMAMYKLGRHLAFYDKTEEAMEWISKAVDKGYDDLDYIKIDPALTGLREDSRFKELLQR